MMKLTIRLMSVLCIVGVAATAQAAPIPSLSSLTGVFDAGESDIFSFTNAADNVNVDWVVTDAASVGLGPAGAFAYMYQVESTSASTVVDVFTISFPNGNTGGILSSGTLAGVDLDSIHNLVGEEEGFTLQTVGLLGGAPSISAGNITFHFANALLQGNESEVLYFVHNRPPQYGNATLQDSVPPSPWATTAPGSDPIPVPVPLPAAIWAAMPILAGLGLTKKFKK